MNLTTQHKLLAQDVKDWLKLKVFPLWNKVGINLSSGIFTENLDMEGRIQKSPSRALVQARQIYSYAEAIRLKVTDEKFAKDVLEKSTDHFIEKFSLSSGAFIHAVDEMGQPHNHDQDLYTQAFTLFGLAQAYEICGKNEYKEIALKLMTFLSVERRNPNGGFTEIKNGKVLYQSNPHMHLFEAAIAWIRLDSNLIWLNLADELHGLCVTKFIDKETGLLAEHFNEKWEPLRENRKFIFEPGHLYEWSWLLKQFQLLKPNSQNVYSRKLFDLAEQHGLSKDKKLVWDEVWSDGTANKLSSRFWPHCERVKAAIALKEAKVADKALRSLIDNYLLLDKGLWRDTLLSNGSPADLPVKASSLYHIINALSEYLRYRHEIDA